MATTNLISKSLGNILTQSGNGVPDHTAPIGSLYVNEDNATLYVNKDGLISWEILQTVSYGEAFYQDNAVETVITSTNTWTEINNNFGDGFSNGFNVINNTLVLENGRDGLYNISANITISRVGGTPQCEIGISKNNLTPINSAFNGATVNSTYTTAIISINYYENLVGGDNLRLAIRNLFGTNNIIIKHAQIHAVKIN